MLIIDENRVHIDESTEEAVMDLTIAVIATYKKINDERGESACGFCNKRDCGNSEKADTGRYIK